MNSYLLAFSIFLSSPFMLTTEFVKAEVNLFSLCSKFPHNSKCTGYEAPVSLKSRLGDKAQCFLSSQEKPEDCKVNITDKALIFYMETGSDLDVLDGAKNTEDLVIPLTTIQSFSYSEKKKTDIGAVLAFGVWGLLSKKKTSTFNFRLEPQEETKENAIPKQAIFVVKRSVGREIRLNLEKKTGLTAELLDIE